MPTAFKVILTKEENQTLQEFEVVQTIPRRTKQRAIALRQKAKGLKVKQIAEYLG